MKNQHYIMKDNIKNRFIMLLSKYRLYVVEKLDQ